MNWENAQLLIVPALMVFFQALKQIQAVEARKQYLALISLVLGALVTVGWVLTGTEPVDRTALFLAVLNGVIYGAAAVGLYDFQKSVRTRNG